MAFAAVISLKNTIHRLKNLINFPQITKPAYDEELDSLRSMLKRLDDESSRRIDRSVINELDAKIRDEVWKVEDLLESYYSLIPPSQGLDEKGVEQEMNSFLKNVKILREKYNTVLQQKPLPAEEDEGLSLSAAVPPANNSTTVGLSDLSQNIINQLLEDIWQLFVMDSERFVSLVGMAGIGKTHLARQIYHHPRIVQHFDVRVWVRVGPKYQINIIFADILAQIEGKPRDLLKEESEDTLIDLLHKSLLSRRYLIVFDDIWTTQFFHYITLLNLEDHRNDSRFLITTRLQEVAEYNSDTIHQMPFLNSEESWNLLWQNVFVAEKSFPSHLEKVGRKIAENCEGLPLLILTIANILRGLDKTEESWRMVAEKKTTTFTDAYDQIYEVLLSSYEYLPQHLKACFLYMGVFPQSSEIPASKLINLWAVEDILDPTLSHLYINMKRFSNEEESQQQKLEMFAIECLEDLVSKSLVIVCKRSSITSLVVRRIRSSKLHSAYWYLCVREAGKNKLFQVLNKLNDVISIESHRRLSVQNNILLGIKEVHESMAEATSTTSTARSLLCTGEDHQYPVQICFSMMLLIRVLDALAIRFYEFQDEVLNLLQLRYLSLTHNGELPSSINKLQQLRCLILNRHHNIKFSTAPRTCLPEEIWDLQELRHLWIMGRNLPDPIKGTNLPKLLRLYVNANSCTEAVFRSIPNLEKLGIKIELQPDSAETISCLEHIGVLNKLESLKCVVVNPRLQSQLAVAPPDHLSNLPRGLKKLSLNGLGYSWKYMCAIGSLPWLHVLKLRCSAFQGAEWKTEGGQFKILEYLLLEDIDLVHWTGHGSRYNFYDKFFPHLHHLIVRHCYKLKKIPSEFGNIPFLEMMDVDDCSPSVVASAHKIKGKCDAFDLQVVVNSSWS